MKLISTVRDEQRRIDDAVSCWMIHSLAKTMKLITQPKNGCQSVIRSS